MKLDELGSIPEYLSALDEDLTERVDELFGRYPALQGFSVQGTGALPEAVRAAVMAAVRAALAASWGKKPICHVHVLTL